MSDKRIIVELQVSIKNGTCSGGCRGAEKDLTNSDLCGSKEAAKILGIHPQTLISWRKKGKVQFQKIAGRCIYFKTKLSGSNNQIELFINQKGGTHDRKIK